MSWTLDSSLLTLDASSLRTTLDGALNSQTYTVVPKNAVVGLTFSTTASVKSVVDKQSQLGKVV